MGMQYSTDTLTRGFSREGLPSLIPTLGGRRVREGKPSLIPTRMERRANPP
jgi:hypothetical protein